MPGPQRGSRVGVSRAGWRPREQLSNADGKAHHTMIHRREISLLIVIAALGFVLAAPRRASSRARISSDLFLGNLPVLIVAIGDDARHPDRRDRHLGRIDVRDLRRRRRRCRDRRLVQSPVAVLVVVRRAARCSAPSTARSSPIVGLPSIVVTLATMVAWRDGVALVRRRARGCRICRRRSSGSASRRLRIRSCRCARRRSFLQAGDDRGCLRHVALGRAIYATGSDVNAARLAGIRYRAREVGGVRGRRCVDRAGGAAERRPLQSDSKQRRPRARDEGHRGRRRRRRGDPWRPRTPDGHTPRRRAARRDRPGADVPRRQRLTGSARCRAPIILAAVRGSDALARASRAFDARASRGIGPRPDASGADALVEQRVDPGAGARRGNRAASPSIAHNFFTLANFFEIAATQRRARAACRRADTGHRERRHRPVGRLDDGTRGCRLRRGGARLAHRRLPIAAGLALTVGLPRRRDERVARRAARDPTAHRDARDRCRCFAESPKG